MGATMQMRGPEAMRQNPLLLPAESGFAPAEIPGLRKAAILMVALGDDLAKTLFQSLSDTDVRRVTDEITRLGEVPAQQLTQVMTEFYGLLETQQYMVRGGPEYALKLLTEAFGAGKAEDLLAEITQGGESHTTSILYGGGAALVNSAGVPWTAAYIDSIGDPTCDLRSNIAAEARAKIVYERLINVTSDPGIKEALGFLMTREVAHQKSFEKALYAIEPNFPPGKMPPKPEFASVYYDMSQGDGRDVRGPWNSGGDWKFVSKREEQCAVDGGDGTASVKLDKAEKSALEHVMARTMSHPDSDPMTGAELGVGPGPDGMSHRRSKK